MISQAFKKLPGCGVQADRGGEKLVQKVHRSVLVDTEQSDMLESWNRDNPRG